MSGKGEVDDEDFTGTSESGLAPVQTPLIHRGDAPQEDDFDVIETDDEGKPVGGAPAAGTESRLSEGEAGQQPLIPAEAGEPGQQQPRREPKSARNARRRESRERVYNENAALRAELDALRNRFDGFSGAVEPRLVELGDAQIRERIGGLDRQISDADAAHRAASRDMANAMASSDNEGLTQALERRDDALVRKTQLRNEKTQIEKTLERARTDGGGGQNYDDRQQRQPQQPQRQTAPAASPLPTRAQHFASEFGRNFDWFKPENRTDMDSQIVLAIDNAVAAEGFDPSTPDYWDEIEDRMRDRMPHRFDAAPQNGGRQPAAQQRQAAPQTQQPAPAQQQRRGPPTAGSSDRGTQSSKREVRISPARKDAMILAGAIDNGGRILDDGKYKRLLKSYSDYDRTNTVR